MKKLLLAFLFLPLTAISAPTAIYTATAPAPIGTYSQAIKVGNTVYIAGQIPMDVKTNQLVNGTEAQINQAFINLKNVVEAAGGNLSDIVKLNIYLTDLNNITIVNSVMDKLFKQPYPARSTVAVAGLAKGAVIEVEAVMVLK